LRIIETVVIFDYKMLKKEVVNMYNTYDQSDDIKALTTATTESKKKDQRRLLENSVDGLKKKIRSNYEFQKQESSRILKENLELISEINDLRKEMKELKD